MIVVGAGISGIACALALHDAGVGVRVVDRGYRIGGRMASKRVADRQVDLGASYFTVSDDRFATVVERWVAAGLAAPWTDTFHVLSPDAAPEVKDGPVRWRAPRALRSLVEDLATGLPTPVRRSEVGVVTGTGDALSVDGDPASAVVLAMPDPQAVRLLGSGLDQVAAVLDRAYEPVLALVACFAERTWDLDRTFEGAFVNDDPDLAWIADDGRRRGDDAPVLVAHSTSERAAQHLDHPDAAGPALVAALHRLLDLPEPVEVLVKRWSVARPAGERAAPYLLDDRLLGVCGDGWGAPRVEGAYLSGLALGEALASGLA